VLHQLTKVWFWLAILVVGFLWGIACVHFKIFPYSILQNAKQAAEAWSWVLEGQPTTFVGFEGTRSDPPGPRPLTTTTPEFILIGGGPKENLPACPDFGCLAWIMDRQGTIRHTWQIDPRVIIDGMSGYSGAVTPDNLKPHDWHLSAEGDLFVIFESIGTYPYGGSIAKFDWHGTLIWSTNNRAHHWMTVDQNGLMYMPALKTAATPFLLGNTKAELECDQGGVEIDTINVVNPSGEVVEEIDVLERLLAHGLVGLLKDTASDCDPLHLNFVQVVGPELARSVAELNAGDLLLSVRNINALMLLGAGKRDIKWLLVGHTARQHSPRPNLHGDILIFDNYGGPRAFGGSRLAKTRVGWRSVETVFPTPQSDPNIDFFSKQAGHIVRHRAANRVLVALTAPGRILEIDLDGGDVIWEYHKQFDSLGYPGADRDNADQRFVRVEAYGAYYVWNAAILARLGEAGR